MLSIALNEYNLPKLIGQFEVHFKKVVSSLQNRIGELDGELSTIRSKYHQQLQTQRLVANRLEQVLRAIPDGIVVLDGNGKIKECNPAAEQLLGIPLVDEFRFYNQGGYVAFANLYWRRNCRSFAVCNPASCYCQHC